MSGSSTQDPAAQAVIQAYNQVIGRDPTAAELATSVQQLQGGASIGDLRAYLATTGYAANALGTIYAKALGRPITAPELASDEHDLAAGGSLGGLLGYLATTAEAEAAVDRAYVAVLSRRPAAPELAAAQGQLQNSYSLAGVRYMLATSPTGIAAVQAAFQDVSGRAPTPGELTGAEAATGTGAATLAGLRAYFAGTAEATGKLQALYLNELGRAVTPGEVATDEADIAKGSSLAAIRGYLSSSDEAVRALRTRYSNLFSTVPANGPVVIAGTDLAAAEQALARGASLQAAVLAVPSTINFDYRLLLGTSPSASELAAIEQGVENAAGPNFATVQGAVAAAAASSPEFAAAISAAFQAAFGRPATAAEITSYGAMLSFGTPGPGPDAPAFSAAVTLPDLRRQIGSLGLQALYQAELGRAITAPELDAGLASLGQGTTAAQIRAYLATSTEAATALLRQYQATFGAPATTAALAGSEQALAAGANLQAAVAANHSATPSGTSTDNAVQLLTLFQAVFKGPESVADLAASEQALAGGASVATAAVSNPYGLPLIADAYQRLLGSAPTAGDVAAVAQAFTQTVGTRYPTQDADGLQEALNVAAAASSTFTNAINASFQAAIGRPANAVELAAYRSELDSGAESSFDRPYNVQPAPTLPALEQQIAQLSAGPSATYGTLSAVAAITPQTIAGVPGFVYGLFDNDALISPSASANVSTGFVGNFDPRTDILQVERSQAASFGALNLVQTNPGQNGSQILFTTVQLAGGASIELVNVQRSDLSPANFRFV